MKFEEFKKISERSCNRYFYRIDNLLKKNKIQIKPDAILLFPTIILFIETEGHFIFELFGAKREFNGLDIKIHKEKSTFKYICQFSSEREGKGIKFDAEGNLFSNFLFSRSVDYDALKKRFFFCDKWQTQLTFNEGEGSVIFFGENFKSCYFNNCLFVNRLNEIYRVKHTLYMGIVNKERTKDEYLQDLAKSIEIITTKEMTVILGVHLCRDNQDENLILSGQFSNMFLIPDVRESNLSNFLEQYPSFLKKAFSCNEVLPQKKFEWQEGNTNPNEESIIPDFMLKREDGYCDICDLKTPCFDKDITKGKHKRRRFIDYIDEGLSQLANYEDYFKFQKNKEFAKSKYNIEVLDPRLILIVGNYENATEDEIREASRKLKSNYLIIDYDTLNTLFLQ